MFSCDDTFPIRQPHLSLSPNIKISPSSDSPNFPPSHMGSPKTVTHVCTALPARSQALGGFPPLGSGLDGRRDEQSPCREGATPCSPAWPRDGAAGGEGLCLEPLPASASPSASRRFSKAGAASAPRLLLLLLHPPSTGPFSPASPSASRSPRVPTLPRSQSTPYPAGGFPLAHLMLNILCARHAACGLPGCLPCPGSCEAVRGFSSPAQCLLLHAKHHLASETLIPSQNVSTGNYC